MNPVPIPQELLDLAPGKQEKIADWMTSGPAFARRRVRSVFKMDLSEAALGAFVAWRQVSRHLVQVAALVDCVKETLAAHPGLELADETLPAAGQLLFERLAVQNQDSALFARLRKLRQKDRALALEARRVGLLEKQAALEASKKERAPEKELNAEEKQEKINGYFGLARTHEEEPV